jgi:hypothetical protein
MNPVLMDIVVMLAGAVDELMDDDEYASGALKVLESMVAEFERLNPDERREFVVHVQKMAAEAERNPIASASRREFLTEFPASFGLADEE